MARPGGRITVSKSVVTDIRIEATSKALSIGGVDQDKAGGTVASHALTFTEDELPERVRQAVKVVAEYATRKITEA